MTMIQTIDNVHQTHYIGGGRKVAMMANSPTQIRIDSTVKREANVLFDRLGLDMSTAVNIFLKQCILRGGLPFKVELPEYSEEVLAAAAEARSISQNPEVPGYTSMNELKKALEA